MYKTKPIIPKFSLKRDRMVIPQYQTRELKGMQELAVPRFIQVHTWTMTLKRWQEILIYE